ncbi:alpha/beta hydrolase [Amycolatopsis carbonis]|uniref:Alpha/beta hydrolase n=1 Tax=Amycolatopsis carbonis TaxID=715471 RepID=A0A9Y2MNQ4_9PSEU|nr:alpha/beta hydrolase [Amycolatopsis sp. 2-15]WIX75085.1 alpha/beta hydrolase [Amycolatopsis sp. 2-15]
MPDLTMRDDTRLHVRDEGAGPTLLLLPGWGVSTWWFRKQFETLTDSFRVVSYDPRGQGESDKTTRGQRTARLAADLAEVVAWTGDEPVHLMAWSGGGSTALQYVELFGTDRLRTLTLVGASPKLLKSEGWDLGFADLEGLLGWVGLVGSDFGAAAESLLPAFFAAALSPEDREATLAEMRRCDQAAMALASWDFIIQDYRDVLALIKVPTLVVTGADDVAVPAGNAPYLHEHITGSRLEIIEKAAHCPFLEQPDQFDAVLRKFLDA